jgi:hypothetical protein
MEKGANKFVLILFIHLIAYTPSSELFAQDNFLQKIISVKADKQPISKILDKITSEYSISFSYNSTIVKSSYVKSVDTKNVSLENVLTLILDEFDILFKMENGVVILFKQDFKPIKPLISKKVIYGKVTDQVSGQPIAGVNVFISETTIGASTDNDGYYRLSTTLSGKYELVFSHITHFPVIKVINITEPEVVISTALKEMISELKEVIITDSRKEWEFRVNLFEKEFIGQTRNASRCKIANPWVLDFEYDEKSDLLTATAQDLLVIKNEALGYTVSHLLVLFERQAGQTKYISKVKFEKMETKNQIKERKWQKKRLKAYLGSFEHFIKALADDKLKKEGFEISSIPMMGDNVVRSPIRRDAIIEGNDSLKYIRIPELLEVHYKDFEESSFRQNNAKKISSLAKSSYQMSTEPISRQKSILEIISQLGYAIIENGCLKDPLSIKQHGYWAWKRSADSLPLDFIVEIK